MEKGPVKHIFFAKIRQRNDIYRLECKYYRQEESTHGDAHMGSTHQEKFDTCAVGEKTGISKSFLQLAETNQRSPRICDLEKIAKALDCRIQDLYDSEYK